MRQLLLLLLALLLPSAALAEPRVGVRVGDHPGFGRVVFDWPEQTAYRVEEAEGRVVLRFGTPASFDLGAVRRAPRNLAGITAEGGAVTLAVAPGARLRHFRLGTRVVVDLMDPAPAAASAAVPAAAPGAASGAVPARPRAPAAAARTPQAPSRAAPPATAPAAAPVEAPAPVVAPAPSPAAPPPPAVEPMLGGLLIPTPADTGAALLRRGGLWLLVLDAPVALDLAPLRSGRLAGTEIVAGAHATVLRLPAAALGEPRLTRARSGWLLEDGTEPPVLRSIRPELEAGPPARLLLRAARPQGSVAVLDPETGATLLVGTVGEGGEGTPLGRRAAIFDILPTRLGTAILPRADSVTMRALESAFVADAGPGNTLALGVEPAEESEALGLSRLFDLPAEPLPALLQRERNATLAVAGAPPLARGLPRLRNAEALLALGLGAEAQAMTALAMREDPRLAEDPRAHALHGAAALLAGRPGEADGLLHRRLPDSDELALWRGLLAAARGEAGAARIAAALPLLRAWPEPLRERLGPRAAEALAEGGEAAAAGRLLAGREEDPAYALARALLLEATGEREAAIAAYENVARGRDRRARAVAMRRAVELRLATGALDAAGGAAAMEAVLAAWRGDAAERAARLRLAELRSAAGDGRGAFEALREVEQHFPDSAAALRPLQAEALLKAIATEPPVSAVALFDAHAALLPTAGAPTARALGELADRLAALDLVERARAVLAQALGRTEDAEARAQLGLKLAELALGAGDHSATRAALSRTEAPDLPAPLSQARRRAEARALAQAGEIAEAVAAFRAAGPAAAAELAELLASRQDWAGAAATLLANLPALLPPSPEPLPEASRRLVARTAALLALAGDQAGLAALRAAEGGRMAGGTFDDAFTLMTGARIDGVGDLPRLRQELELARLLPARLESLREGPGSAR